MIHPLQTPTSLKETGLDISTRRLLTSHSLPKSHRLQLLRGRTHPLPHRLLLHNCHLHRGLPPIHTVIMSPVGIRTARLHLLLIQTIQNSINDWRHGSQVHIHYATGDRIGNVFKVVGIAFDQYTAADDGVDGSGHGEELGGVGEFVCAGYFLDEDVVFLDFAFLYALL